MSRHSANNSRVFKVRLKNFAKTDVSPILIEIGKESAQLLVDFVEGRFVMPDGTTQFPVDTANLHDATGVAVYGNGRTEYFLPTTKATKPQSHNGTKGLYGSDLLKTAISSSATQYSNGVWVVLFSAVPYAYKINEQGSKIGRGAGFFDVLMQYILTEAIRRVKQRFPNAKITSL